MRIVISTYLPLIKDYCTIPAAVEERRAAEPKLPRQRCDAIMIVGLWLVHSVQMHVNSAAMSRPGFHARAVFFDHEKSWTRYQISQIQPRPDTVGLGWAPQQLRSNRKLLVQHAHCTWTQPVIDSWVVETRGDLSLFHDVFHIGTPLGARLHSYIMCCHLP